MGFATGLIRRSMKEREPGDSSGSPVVNTVLPLLGAWV